MILVFELFDQESVINANIDSMDSAKLNSMLLAKMKSIQKMTTLNFNELLICHYWLNKEIGLKILTVN